MKRLFAMLLVLIMVISLVPVAAAADTWWDYAKIEVQDGKILGYKYGQDKPVTLTQKDYDTLLEQYKEHLESEYQKWLAATHDPGKHEYTGYGSNTKYHWLECACGCKISMEPHVDPKDAPNDYCICGYHFSDNAELVTLWLQDCEGLKNFRKDVFEYETNAFTYKDVKEIKRIATRTHDSEATVEIPEDLTLKDGENKIEIKVTSENKKVTKVYTVIVNKEPKK